MVHLGVASIRFRSVCSEITAALSVRNLLLALVALVGFALFMGAVWAGCSTFLKNSEAYDRGLATALADPTVQEVLGAPVRESWFINGVIESDGAVSRGSWITRVRGEAASGTLTIGGLKRAGRWGVISLALEVGGATYVYREGVGFVRADPGEVPEFDIL